VGAAHASIVEDHIFNNIRSKMFLQVYIIHSSLSFSLVFLISAVINENLAWGFSTRVQTKNNV